MLQRLIDWLDALTSAEPQTQSFDDVDSDPDDWLEEQTLQQTFDDDHDHGH